VAVLLTLTSDTLMRKGVQSVDYEQTSCEKTRLHDNCSVVLGSPSLSSEPIHHARKDALLSSAFQCYRFSGGMVLIGAENSL
jgi:hypothetical protein